MLLGSIASLSSWAGGCQLRPYATVCSKSGKTLGEYEEGIGEGRRVLGRVLGGVSKRGCDAPKVASESAVLASMGSSMGASSFCTGTVDWPVRLT